jgi:hypothetical protein
MGKLGKKLFENKILVMLLIIVIFLAALAHINKNSIYTWAYDQKLVPIPETFTELYFSDHLNLPKQIGAGKDVSFSFVIHNLEGKDMTYPYVVYLKFNNSMVVLSNDSVIVKKDEYKTIDVSYEPKVSTNNGTITVSLTQLNQDIHFLLSNNLE